MNSFDNVSIILNNHIGFLALVENSCSYGKLINKLADSTVPALLTLETAASAYMEDSSGFWDICRKENLFPIGYTGDGDLIVLQAQSDLIAVVVIDYIKESKEDWLWETKFSLIQFIDAIGRLDFATMDWLYP